MIRRSWRQFDWLLLGAIIILGLFGVMMISSAVKGDPALTAYPGRQLGYLIAGLILLFAVSAIDYNTLSTFTIPIYILVLGLLALVGVIGSRIFGAQSWLDVFGLFPIQPSELAKVALALILAKFLADREENMGSLKTVLLGLALMIPLLVLVFLEPDLGTAVVLAVEGALIFIAAGLRLRHMILAVVAGIALIPTFWALLNETQRTRLLIFVDPTADPDSYFNVEQALVSIGSGGILGKGFGEGTQSQLHFLRVRHTDFIFSVVAEEMGFIGALIMLALLFFILMRLWRIADRSRNAYGRLLVAGVAAVILFQTIVNVGMNMALLPVTGLPLPFVSYGGNALLSLMLLVGLVQSVAMGQKRIDF
ncbi:MAG: rod shape-determining protein RodA [Caldilineales bacterium]|nr:rod shape-determining protein RodA [Caldilineales bacterium]